MKALYHWASGHFAAISCTNFSIEGSAFSITLWNLVPGSIVYRNLDKVGLALLEFFCDRRRTKRTAND